jgi:hypothetical protein
MLKAIHICTSHQPTQHQKLQKSMSTANFSKFRKEKASVQQWLKKIAQFNNIECF